ncbi:hypothetical protein DITRI_Ditri14bG0078600 [Diplodiscus trichospermus]
MELIFPSPTKRKNQTLPPRRGQVKIRIIKCFLKSVTSIAWTAKEILRKREKSGSEHSSSSTTAAPTQSGYNSDGSLN